MINLAKRLFKDSLLSREEIKDEIRLIEGTDIEYISIKGAVYKLHHEGKFLKRKLDFNKRSGYMYARIFLADGSRKKFRVHRLVAKAFIENPHNLPIVGHKNNIKSDNRVENLYWTTISENTQKAVNDGLMVNRKGYEDEQSLPVVVYDLVGNELARFGSVSMCAKHYSLSKSTILRHCRFEIKTKPRKGFIFRFDGK